ncbi:MAG: protein phosphatase 2C domain-containing protein [Chloroflexota bacterium]|nr:protein phosphatase 2C domain-containing protein [Chloroflexota bacterium]
MITELSGKRMLENFRNTYSIQRWSGLVQGGGLIVAACILIWASGGFPPFLVQVLPHILVLWKDQGPRILLPLASLVVFCATLLAAWGLLIFAAWKMFQHALRYRHEQQRFEEELLQAERQALHDAQQMAAQSAHAAHPPQSPLTQPVARPQRVAAAAAPSVSPSPAALRAFRTPPAGYPPRATMNGRAAVEEAYATQTRSPVDDRGLAEYPTRIISPTQRRTSAGQPARTVPLAGEPRAPFSSGQQPEPGILRLVVGSATDPGLKRKQKPNEDNLLAMQGMRTHDGQPFGLFVVADGMGGHSNGREASRLVIQTFNDIAMPALLNSVETGDAYFTDLLLDGLQHANLLLYQRNKAQNADMGTTMTAALLFGARAYVVNVGDSRTYLHRPSEGLSKITRDHSVVARLVDEGSITPEDVYTHPKRNQIYRCMGEKGAVDADAFSVSLQAGDTLLLCSDGLWEMVRDPQIERILGLASDPAQNSQHLIQAALDGGGEDNVTVVVAQVMQVPTL